MIKVVANKLSKKTPEWVLMLLASFPVEIGKPYRDCELEGLKNAIRSHIGSIKYKQRNTEQKLIVTHSICESERSFTIYSYTGRAQLEITIETCEEKR